MTREKFRPHQTYASHKRSKTFMIISNVLLIAGTLVIVIPLFYLLFHLDKSDALLKLITPFIFGGIGLLIISQLIFPFQFKKRR